MKHKSTIVAIAALAVLGITMLAPTTKAATNWKDYFSKDEGKAIAKLADKYIREQLDDNAKEWKGLISSKTVDSSIAKKKIFTGSISCSEAFADKAIVYDDGSPANLEDDSTEYYKKVSFDDIDMKKPPVIQLYNKAAAGTVITQLNSDLWETATAYVSDGEVWFKYGLKNADNGNRILCDIAEYKLVINY